MGVIYSQRQIFLLLDGRIDLVSRVGPNYVKLP
jgi:hypothetical protein